MQIILVCKFGCINLSSSFRLMTDNTGAIRRAVTVTLRNVPVTLLRLLPGQLPTHTKPMAKATRQNKDDPAAPNPNAVPNKDVMQRLNFLYQASAYLNSIPSTTAAVDHSSSSSPKEQPPIASTSASAIQSGSVRGGDGHDRRRVDVPLADLSRSYVGAMRAIGKKTVVKM